MRATLSAAAWPRIGLSICLWISLAGSACKSEDSTSDSFRAVQGVVRDATTDARLKGVSIAFRSDTLDEAGDRTDSDGEYLLEVHTDSKHGRIEARKSGYETRVVSVYFDSDAVVVNIELNAN